MTVKLDLKTPPEKNIELESSTTLPATVTDSDGVVYHLKSPTALDELDLTLAMGQDSSNITALFQVMPLLYIEKINGEDFKFAGSMNGIRAAVKRVGTNGMRAVTVVVTNYKMAQQVSSSEGWQDVKK